MNPWPHRLAMLLVSLTFPLIWVGGLVTTTQAGMAVPDWPNTYGYNLFLYPWTTWLFGPWDLFIEHGHRLLGALVGMVTIALAIGVWRFDRRPWLRGVSLLAIVAVTGQGILGGMRVLLDERTLAKIHGCTGPVFFALAVALTVFTSRWWKESSFHAAGNLLVKNLAGRFARLAFLTTLLAYIQLVLGAELRHVAVGSPPQYFRTAVYFHLIMAAVLTLHVLWLSGSLLWNFRGQRIFTRPALGLLSLIFLQLLLGSGTWVAKYAWPGFLAEQSWTADYTITAGGMLQSLVVTGHVATGSLILVTTLLLLLRLSRVEWLTTHAEAPAQKETLASPASDRMFFLGQAWPAVEASS